MRDRFSLLCSLVTGLFLATSAAAAAAEPSAATKPFLVRDFHQGPADDSATSGDGISWNGVFFHMASDPAHGMELWRSDGTPGGSRRLSDICPGHCDGFPEKMAVSGGWLYFTADDGVSGRELWRSDGRPGGEQRVRDLCPGPCDAEIFRMIEFQGQVFFFGEDASRRSLWRTDGTSAGTVRVADVCPVSSGCQGTMRVLRDRLLLPVPDPETGEDALWRSDGTAAGTGRIDPLSGRLPGVASEISEEAGGFVFFWAGGALWRTDGTPQGTLPLAESGDLLSGSEGGLSFPVQSVVWNGHVYWAFSAGEVVRSDGTPRGTARIADFGEWAPRLLARRRGVLVQVDKAGDEIWWIREGGAVPEKILLPGEQGSFSVFPLGEDDALLVVRGLLESGLSVLRLTEAGASSRRVEAAPFPRRPHTIYSADALVFYVTGTFFQAHALWRTDGTDEGTVEVRDLRAPARVPAVRGRRIDPARVE